MKRYLKPTGITLLVIVIAFVVASFVDIFYAAMSSRFYSRALFVTIFGVAGIFAGFFSWVQTVDQPKEEMPNRWFMPLLLLGLSLLFVFVLAPIEGGEYESAFFSFGLMMGLTTLFLIWQLLREKGGGG